VAQQHAKQDEPRSVRKHERALQPTEKGTFSKEIIVDLAPIALHR